MGECRVVKEESGKAEALSAGPVLRGFLVAVVFGFLVLILFSLVLSIFGVRPADVPLTMIFLAYLVAVLGGIIAGHRSSAKGWLAGGLAGVMFLCFLLLLDVLFLRVPIHPVMAMVRILIALPIGAVGGMLGMNLRSQ